MKKVLIALDYDPLAEKVANTGYAIAKALNASVLLLHVVAEPAYYSTADYSPIMGFSGYITQGTAEITEKLKQESQRYLEESKKHLEDDRIDTLVVEGDYEEAIIESAKTYQADLIVMGTHRRKGLEKFLMGNLAEKIMNAASIPLLIIPSDSKS